MSSPLSAPLPLAAGPVDVHAHFVPIAALTLPTADGPLVLSPGPARLQVGDLCLPLTSPSITDPADLLADMDAHGIAVRVLSGPPFTFATDARGQAAVDYAQTFNTALAQVCADSGGRLVGLGLIPLADPEAAAAEMDRLLTLPGIRGIALPPVVDGLSFDEAPLRTHLANAAVRGLSVFVHPVQTVRPELSRHYLSNLVGNPTESAVGIASLLLGGVLEENPNLRICFAHGGGTAASLLGRWDHGWTHRTDARGRSTVPPSRAARAIWVDILKHEPRLSADLVAAFGEDRVALGSDYPFDMGDVDPVGSAQAAGLVLETLERNARAFLGLTPDHHA